MIIVQEPIIQILAVIVDDHKIRVGARLNRGGSQHVLRDMVFGRGGRVSGPIIGQVSVYRFWPELGKIGEPALKLRDADGWRGARDHSQYVEQKPETGGQSDGPQRQNCKSMTPQTAQFNITGK